MIDVPTIPARQEPGMDIPLAVAILALLAFALLPVVERFNSAETGAKGPRSFLIGIALWLKE
jgi:hypothetical protein